MRGNSGDKRKDYLLAMERTSTKIQMESSAVKEAFWIYILMHLNIALVRDVFDLSNQASFFYKLKIMKEIIKESIFEEALTKAKIKNAFSPRMLPIMCLKNVK